MSQLGPALSFASRLYQERAALAYAGYVQHDPMALLQLRPGRVDPYAIYERMRAGGTLTPTRFGNLATTSHRLCNAVLRDRRFHTQVVGQPHADDDTGNMSFLDMDPPDHTRLRRLVSPAFTPKAVAGYRQRIETTVGDLLDRATGARRFDLVSAFAAPVPIAVITDLLGIPDADARAFSRYGATIGSAIDGIKSLGHARQMRASSAKLAALFTDLLDRRRREPADDILSTLVAAEGDQVKAGEIFPLCILLLVAGFETTVNLIGNGVMALLQHPEQWEALCADPPMMAPKVVEEVLRFDSPVQRTMRVAAEPLELDGKPVRRNQFVIALIGAANRDPEAYDRPNVFDIHRDSGPDHLAFSSGIHYCLGQSLARLEATIAFEMLATRLPGLHRRGPVRRRNANTIRGPIHLPVAA